MRTHKSLAVAMTLAVVTCLAASPQVVRSPFPSETVIVKQFLVPALSEWVEPDAIERRLWDRSRADFLSDDFAFEVDWSKKWAEGIGQALFYAAMTEKEPALFLLVKDLESERRYLLRAKIACDYAGVSLGIYDVARKKVVSAPMFGHNPQAPW